MFKMQSQNPYNKNLTCRILTSSPGRCHLMTHRQYVPDHTPVHKQTNKKYK